MTRDQGEVGIGNGGWVRCDAGAFGPVWARYREADDGRLEVAELYIAFDNVGGGAPSRLRRVADALSHIEAVVAEHAEDVRARLQLPGPDLRTSAEHYATTFSSGREPTEGELGVLRDRRFHWVALERWSQITGTGIPRPPSPRRAGAVRVGAEQPAALLQRLQVAVPGSKPYPPEFFEAVGAAYRAALALGGAPAKRIADANRVPVKTVHGWVAAARLRGDLPPARTGRAG